MGPPHDKVGSESPDPVLSRVVHTSLLTADGYRTYAVDLRGHGDSRFAADLAKVIQKKVAR